MIRSRRSQIVLAFLAAVAAAVLTRGVAYAETTPGTAESDSSSTVEVSGTDSSSVSVTTTSDSTTTVGSSSDGSGTTPEITNSTNTTGTNDVNSNDTSGPAEQTIQQNDQSVAPTQVDTAQLNQETALGIGQGSHGGGSTGMPNHDYGYDQGLNKSDSQSGLGDQAPAPVVPTSEKNAPVPVSGSGSVNAFSTTGFGAGGKGLSAASFGLGTASVRIQIIILALLMVISASFISYMRRTGFSHAPRSDDSVPGIDLDTNPRVGMQALPLMAGPAFFVASDKQLINFRRGGEWI